MALGYNETYEEENEMCPHARNIYSLPPEGANTFFEAALQEVLP